MGLGRTAAWKGLSPSTPSAHLHILRLQEGTMTEAHDPFAQFKAGQKEAWSLFLPLEQFTMIPAGKLVAFAKVAPGQAVLDVACGTGVVSISAARAGARVCALDLSPTLLERARD